MTSADPPPDVANYVTGDMFRTRLQIGDYQGGYCSATSRCLRFRSTTCTEFPRSWARDGIAIGGRRRRAPSRIRRRQRRPNGAAPGDITALTDFAGSFDLAAFVNPLAAPLFFSDVQDSLARAAASEGDSLDAGALSIALADGHAHVTGKIDATGGDTEFQLRRDSEHGELHRAGSGVGGLHAGALGGRSACTHCQAAQLAGALVHDWQRAVGCGCGAGGST